MGLIRVYSDTDRQGSYWHISQWSFDYTAKIASAMFDLYANVQAKLEGYAPIMQNPRVWKGDDFIWDDLQTDAEKRKAFYDKVKAECDGECVFFPDVDEPWGAKIYELAKFDAKAKHFHNINYKTELTQALYPKRTFVQGELQECIWYADQALSVPVIKVDISYNRGDTGFALDRTTTRFWYNVDGTLQTSTKVTTKVYSLNPMEMIVEGVTRRRNIIDNMKINALGMMQATMTSNTDAEIEAIAKEFMYEFVDEISAFINDSNESILDGFLSASTEDYPWLENIINQEGMTIKDYICNEVNIW
jgi:hypothetical protein